MKKLPLFLLTTLLLFGGTTMTAQTNAEENLIVTVKYKTQPDKSEAAVVAITNLLEQVKSEPNFVSIDMLVDPSDNTNILLYEVWSNGDYYKGAHMETEHIQQFIANSRNFLAGPPEIIGWKLEKKF